MTEEQVRARLNKLADDREVTSSFKAYYNNRLLSWNGRDTYSSRAGLLNSLVANVASSITRLPGTEYSPYYARKHYAREMLKKLETEEVLRIIEE